MPYGLWFGGLLNSPTCVSTDVSGRIGTRQSSVSEDLKFGEIEVEGKRYTHDVVIEGGKVRKRKKGPSKEFREKFGHTPLSAGEQIPWGGKRLIVGTGAHGALPVMDEVLAEAKRRRIEVIAAPTLEVCRLLEEVKEGQAYAILHCTC